MGVLKEFVLELDLFTHQQFLRYRSEPGYRTLTGGILSIVLIIIFIGIFASLAIDTVQNNIIISQTSVSYDTDPESYQLVASPSNKFMFAVGLTGVDLSATQKYFDILLEDFTVVNNVKSSVKVALSPCTADQWTGISDQIASSYTSLNFNQWLCPPSGYAFPIQGKKTSTTFRYAKITVSKCGSVISSATCMDSTAVQSFIDSNQGVTLNYYYINPVLNPGDHDYINYYLQDSTYFSFNTNTGVSANLYYSEYSIETDHSIFPWESKSADQGAITVAPPNSQAYSVLGTNTYAKVYLRKSSQRLDVSRSFQKVDQTLSYIGGLLGTVILLLTVMSLYSQFCYEIQFGDKIFKQNQNGSFGSEDFNFIVYLGYGIFNVFAKLGIIIDWKAMKKYHKCRLECLKQLDIELLFKKMEFLQEVAKIVLEDHHLKGLYMLPKKKIKDARKTRKRFQLQNLIYQNLERKAREIHVQDEEYDARHDEFVGANNKQAVINEIINEQNRSEQDDDVKALRQECVLSFKRLQRESQQGQKYSRKIISKLRVKELVEVIFKMNSGIQKSNYGQKVPTNKNILTKPDDTNKPFPSTHTMVNDLQGNLDRDGNQL